MMKKLIAGLLFSLLVVASPKNSLANAPIIWGPGCAKVLPSGGICFADGTTQNTASTSSITPAAIGASPNANAMTYSAGTLSLQPASASFGGVVTTGTQTMAGAKTFSGGITAALTGNASTATALAADPADCSANTFANAINASGTLACTSVPDAALGSSYLKADGSRALTSSWNVGAFNITASTFVGALTGTASLATALAADPADCGSNTFANAINASGTLSCASVPDAALGSSYLKADGTRALTGSWNVGAFNITASTFIGSLTGNASGSAASITGNLTGDATSVGMATTIAANAVTNAKAAQMAAHTFKGNNTGSTANALDLTATQLTAELNAVVGDSGSGGTKGLVPAPASGDAAAGKFLKADGNWVAPSGTGTVTSVSSTVPAGFGVAVTNPTSTPAIAITSNGQPNTQINVGLSNSVAASAWTIALKQSDGSTDCSSGAAACVVAMRHPTATTGGYNVRSVTAALSQAISSGTTLGLAASSSTPIWIYLIDSDGAGTMKLGVSTNRYDPETLQSTVAESFSTSCTQASPSICTSTGHGLNNNDTIQLTGTISGGLTTATTYYVVSSAANTFQLASTIGGAGINKTSGGTQTPTVNVAGSRIVSAGAYASKPVQVIGVANISEATPGTWASAATSIASGDKYGPAFRCNTYENSFGGFGATNVKIAWFNSTRAATGTCYTYTSDHSLGDYWTIVTPGLYAVQIGASAASGSTHSFITINDTNLASGAVGTYAQGYRTGCQSPSGGDCSASLIEPLNAGDVIRFHTDAVALDTIMSHIEITQIGN